MSRITLMMQAGFTLPEEGVATADFLPGFLRSARNHPWTLRNLLTELRWEK